MRTVRKATVADLDTILQLIEEGRKTMVANGNPHQWSKGHPSREQIEHDIASGTGFLLVEDGATIATWAFVPGPDSTYARIWDGSWLEPERPYHVIHRVAGLPGRHGVMASVLAWCEAQDGALRCDTHRDNRIMQHCLAKAGFSYRGIIHLADGSERLAYQWFRPGA